MSDSTASGSPEVLSLDPNPDVVMPLSTAEFERLQGTYSGLWENPEKTCLTCGQKGPFRTIREGREVLVRCQSADDQPSCVEQWMLHLWMLSAGLGQAYQRLGWGHVDGVSDTTMTKVFDYINHASELTGIGHGLTLWGPPGTGKTLLLTLIQRRLMSSGFDTYFCLFNQIVNLHTAGWRSDSARLWFERRIMNAGVLFLDDMGKEQASPTIEKAGEKIPVIKSGFSISRGDITGALVDEMLRHRIQHGRPTFISANLAPEVMEDRYYIGTLGLFQEVNEIIEVQGEDYRTRRRERMADEAKRGLRFPVVIA